MSNITIDVKNDSMLGRINDGVIATRLYSLEKQLEEKDIEIERLNKGINEIIQYINSLELGSDHEETYNKEGYLVDVYDIEKMLVELIGSDKE